MIQTNILLSIILFNKISANENSLRIIGGVEANPNEYPFIVRMEIVFPVSNKSINKHLCSCTTLTPIWTLTAAHCIVQLNNLKTTQRVHIKGVVRYGLLADKFSEILKAIHHPSYETHHTIKRELFLRNDIGLLMTTKVSIESYGKISAIDYSCLVGLKTITAGYGWTNQTINGKNVVDIAKLLQVLSLVVVKCPKEILHNVYPCLCVGGSCSHLSVLCPGDSGGPLLYRNKVVGVNSIGFNCKNVVNSRSKYKSFSAAGLMTPVSPFLNWILKTISSF